MFLTQLLKRGLVSAALLTGIPAQAATVFSVAFDDPPGNYASYYDTITSHVTAAGSRWASNFLGDASLEVVVNFSTTVARAGGSSLTSRYVGTIDGKTTWMWGAASELVLGVDPNGASADIQLTFGHDYLTNELWFDPDPSARSALVPTNRTDAMSVVLHELGHAFAFNGWRNWSTGQLPSSYQSTFDRWVNVDAAGLFFTGPAAVDLYGGAVPLTAGNLFHLGNHSPAPGSDLVPDLMNGVVFNRGVRYDISALDLAMVADTGLHLIPVPGAWVLLLSAAGIVLVIGRIRR